MKPHGSYFWGLGCFQDKGFGMMEFIHRLFLQSGFLSFSFSLYFCIIGAKETFILKQKLFLILILLCCLYFISNFITEFVLVSRSLIPFLLYIFVLINSEKSFNKLNIKDIYEINYKLK